MMMTEAEKSIVILSTFGMRIQNSKIIILYYF